VARERGSATEMATSERVETARTRRLAGLYADRTFRDAYVELERLLDQEPAPADAYRFLVAILAQDGGTISRVCCSLAQSADERRNPERYRMRGSWSAKGASEIAAPGKRCPSPKRKWTIAVGGALAIATAIGAALAVREHHSDLRPGATPPLPGVRADFVPKLRLNSKRAAPAGTPTRKHKKHRSSTERPG
jgi:hypothetical protein